MPIGPPQISAKDKPLRRKVALAYRTAREAGKSHDRAFDAAMTVYLEAHPEEGEARRLLAQDLSAKAAATCPSRQIVIVIGRHSEHHRPLVWVFHPLRDRPNLLGLSVPVLGIVRHTDRLPALEK
jgi:hypothetical protein